MGSGVSKAFAAAIVIIMLTAGLITVPYSSCDSYGNGEYGAVYSFDSKEVDDAIYAVTGKTFQQWVEYPSDLAEKYDFSLDSHNINAMFSTTRDTALNGNEYTMIDHTSGYFNLVLDTNAYGNFPYAGTYYPNEGEDNIQFLKRIFIDEAPDKKTNASAFISMMMYIDLNSVTHADLSTGEITDSNIELKVTMYEKEDRNIDFHLMRDANDNPVSATIGYDEIHADNNFFLDLDFDLRFKGMKVFTDLTVPWQITPVATEHVNKSLISSDLAESIWLEVLKSREDDGGNYNLPELILKLIGSGGRMLDLFDTIKSLTGSDLPDASVTGRFEASNYTDTHGYEYCKLVLQKDDGSTGFTVNLPKAGYMLTIGDLVEQIPDYIIDPSTKNDIALIIDMIGWNDIEVKDISDDLATKNECRMIRSYVNAMVDEDNIESYVIPTVYVVAAIMGIAICLATVMLIWRRTL